MLVLATLPSLLLQDAQTRPWDIVFGQAVPALVMLMIWAIPLDILMAWLFLSDAQGATRARWRLIIKLDVLLWLALIVVWGYFFATVVTQRLGG